MDAIHLGEVKYNCEYCGKMFPYRQSMVFHVERYNRQIFFAPFFKFLEHSAGAHCTLCSKKISVCQKINKSPDQKTREIKYINFTKMFFDQNPFFAISKMAKEQFLSWKKV